MWLWRWIVYLSLLAMPTECSSCLLLDKTFITLTLSKFSGIPAVAIEISLAIVNNVVPYYRKRFVNDRRKCKVYLSKCHQCMLIAINLWTEIFFYISWPSMLVFSTVSGHWISIDHRSCCFMAMTILKQKRRPIEMILNFVTGFIHGQIMGIYVYIWMAFKVISIAWAINMPRERSLISC